MLPELTRVQAQWLTLIVLVAASVGAIIYDVAAIQAWGVDASISRVMRRLFSLSPTFFAAFLFWLGILVGHTFLPTE